VRTGRAVGLTEAAERNEPEQATYLLDLLELYDAGGVDTAFVQTFAARHLPTADDPGPDLDLGSFGIVKVLPAGRTGTTGMPWEPKAAFHALAAYGRARRMR